MNSQPARFDPVALTLHWVVALAVIALLIVGPLMADGDWAPEVRGQLYMMHKSTGFLVLLLVLFRLVWRHLHRPPSLDLPSMPRWQIMAAKIVHQGLYVFLFLTPLAGWAMSSLHSGINFYGLFQVPNLPTPADWGPALAESHEAFATIIAILLVVHIGATFKHHFIDRDEVLLRMTPLWSHGILNKLRGM